MVDSHENDRLSRRLRAAAARQRAAERRVASRGIPGRPGEVIALGSPLGPALDWVLVERGRPATPGAGVAESVLVVPTDWRSLQLPGDVRVGDLETLRPVRTFARTRLPAPAVEGGPCVDVLAAEDLVRVQDGCRVEPQVDPEVLDDEELDWAARLIRATRALGQWTRGERVVVRLAEIVEPQLALSAGLGEVEPPLALPQLAADSRSSAAAFDRLARYVAGEGRFVEELCVAFAGRLRLVATERGVALLGEPDGADVTLPPVVPSADGLGEPLPWERMPDRPAWRAWLDVDWHDASPLLWVGGAAPVVFEVDAEGVFQR